MPQEDSIALTATASRDRIDNEPDGQPARPLTAGDVTRLYEQHRERTFTLAYLACGDLHRAQDAVHEAFCRLLARPERVRDPEKALPYVRSIVLNLLRTEAARAGRATPSSKIEGPARTQGDDPSAQAELAEQGEAVLRALDRLSPRQRECVVLRYWLDLADRDVAATTGMSLGTVKTHLRRGQARLREHLEAQR